MQPCFGTHETSSLCTVMLATVSGSCIARPRAHDNSCRPRHTHNGLGQLEMHSKLILLIIIVLAHHQGERGRQLMDYSYIVFQRSSYAQAAQQACSTVCAELTQELVCQLSGKACRTVLATSKQAFSSTHLCCRVRCCSIQGCLPSHLPARRLLCCLLPDRAAPTARTCRTPHPFSPGTV
jgi:hypothetical protein